MAARRKWGNELRSNVLVNLVRWQALNGVAHFVARQDRRSRPRIIRRRPAVAERDGYKSPLAALNRRIRPSSVVTEEGNKLLPSVTANSSRDSAVAGQGEMFAARHMFVYLDAEAR